MCEAGTVVPEGAEGQAARAEWNQLGSGVSAAGPAPTQYNEPCVLKMNR